jgi:hypothetical protein
MHKTCSLLEKQAKTLEGRFFYRSDKKLIEELHRMQKMKETKEALAGVSGITDDAVLQKLVELNVRPEILATLAMIPLIEVSWADGHMDEKEKKAILDAAARFLEAKTSVDFNLLNRWLERKPDKNLLGAWAVYIKSLCRNLSQRQKDTLKKNIIGQARTIAEAAGGLLGLGPRISRQEQHVLKKLEAVFVR